MYVKTPISTLAKVKGKVLPCTGRTAHRGSRGIALLYLDHGSRRGWGVSVTPRSLFTPGKTRYPLSRRLGGPQDRSGQVRKISPPPGFDPRTVQPVVQPLHRLSYPAHKYIGKSILKFYVSLCILRVNQKLLSNGGITVVACLCT
jgi:hypothetical protein